MPQIIRFACHRKYALCVGIGFIDVLDAQRTLFQSRAQYLSALSARYRSLADLQRYTAVDENAGSIPTYRNAK